MPTVRHKEAACVNISRDFMCLSSGKLIPVQRLCQYLGGTYSCLPGFQFRNVYAKISLECRMLCALENAIPCGKIWSTLTFIAPSTC